MRPRTFAAAGCAAALALTVALNLSAATGPTAAATPGSGTTPSNRVDGTLDGPLSIKSDGIKLKIKHDATVRSFTLTYAGGGFSGWHRHPGLVIATVESGSVTRQLPCRRPHTYHAGEAFTEVGPHFVANADTSPTGTPAVLRITQIVPANTPADGFRKEVDEPKCHH